MIRYQVPPLSDDEHAAIKEAILAGALSSRQGALTTLIIHNKGYQQADRYERELKALIWAADAIVNATPITS